MILSGETAGRLVWTLGVSKALLSRLRVGLSLQPVGPYGLVIRTMFTA